MRNRGNFVQNLNAELMEELAHIESDVPHELLADWYRAMDLFVMPSRYENYSNAVFEVLACGVPCLVSDVGGNQRLAETEGGWLFAQGSADSLVQTLCSIAESPCLARARGRGACGGENVRHRYRWQTSAKRLEEMLHFCLDMKVGTACRL